MKVDEILDDFDVWCRCGSRECQRSVNYTQALAAINAEIAKAVREARIEIANNIWRKYEEQYPDDTGTAAWLRSFVVAENITPQHFKEDGE